MSSCPSPFGLKYRWESDGSTLIKAASACARLKAPSTRAPAAIDVWIRRRAGVRPRRSDPGHALLACRATAAPQDHLERPPGALYTRTCAETSHRARPFVL